MSLGLKHVIVLSETMPLGGTTTFALNFYSGLKQRADWCPLVGSLKQSDSFTATEKTFILEPPSKAKLHEDRIEHFFEICSRLGVRCVVAALSSGPFDFLRHVPTGCLRVGMIQSDDEGVYQLVERYLPWLDLVVGVSQEICRKMEGRMGSRSIPVVHQPYGVPMPEQAPPRSAQAPLRVLYLGRVIEEQKRVGLMARVIQRTLNARDDIHWTIAGDGPELPAMRAEFVKHASRVRFLGGIPYREVPALLPEHDAYFLCSDYEGLPLSLLEAMGAGLVPVVSDLPSGISEVVDDANGIRVALDDEAGYAAGLVRLAEDPALRASMSQRAAEQVRESHSTEAMARRWVEMLDAHLPVTPPVWPKACQATAPLELQGNWRFSPALRPLRRLLKTLRH